MRFSARCSTLGCFFNLSPTQYDDRGLSEIVAFAHEQRNPGHQVHVIDRVNPPAAPGVQPPATGLGKDGVR